MQQTSELYKELIAGNHWKECRILYGKSDEEISQMTSFLNENEIVSVLTEKSIFPENNPSVGGCVSSEISLKVFANHDLIPRSGKVVPQVRLTDGLRHSEWISKGVYFVDTRVYDKTSGILEIHGYDAILKAEQEYPASTIAWPARDIQVVAEICVFLNITIDTRTYEIMNKGYWVQYPAEYSCREALGYIAAMYGGSFIMNDVGKLRLVLFGDIPSISTVLGNRNGVPITFGGELIRV